MKALLLTFSLLPTLAIAQSDYGYNRPMYQYDTLIYRHVITLETDQAFTLPEGAYLYELVPLEKSGELKWVTTDGEVNQLKVDDNYRFNPVTVVHASGSSYPIKFGDQNWTTKPANRVWSVGGAKFELSFFTLAPINEVRPTLPGNRPSKLGAGR